jgi:subtilisin-like proprotein convertase family protein
MGNGIAALVNLGGVLTFVFTMAQPAAAINFSNPAAIIIPELGPANPYPSIITVTSVVGAISDVNVTLTGFSHTFPSDVGVLLVGPGGQRVVLMDGAGGFTTVVNANITLDDQAPINLPASDGIPSGSYRPTNFFPADIFPPPAPGAPYGALLSVFNGTNPNGTWSLFVNDFVAEDSGTISGGWTLSVLTVTAVPEPSTLLLLGSGLLAIAAWMRRKEASNR